MTEAVCIFCGEAKPDAPDTCGSCRRRPSTVAQLAKSLFLSDRFFDHDQLAEMTALIRRGEHVDVDVSARGELEARAATLHPDLEAKHRGAHAAPAAPDHVRWCTPQEHATFARDRAEAASAFRPARRPPGEPVTTARAQASVAARRQVARTAAGCALALLLVVALILLATLLTSR